MRSKYKIVLVIVILALIAILSLMFYLQKNLIDKFSLKPPRLELIFDKDSDSDILNSILAQREYICKKYPFKEETSIDNKKHILVIENGIDSKDEFFKDKFFEYLKLEFPDIKDLDIRDYSHTNIILSEINKGAKLFIAVLTFLIIIIFFIKRIKYIINHLRTDLEIYYLKEILSGRIVEILEESVKLVLLMFGGIFLLQWIINVQFDIPRMYLPPNDIFDFKFYRDLNNAVIPILSSYGNLYNDTLSNIKLLFLAIVIIGIIIFLCILIINKKGFKKYIDEKSLSDVKKF